MSELNDLKKKLAMSSRMLFNSGLVDYSGHISARIPGSDHLLILPHPVSRATVVAGRYGRYRLRRETNRREI